MAEYTVQDTQTGKTVTFQWNGDKPPNDADMNEVFTAARTQIPQQSSPGILSRIGNYTKEALGGLPETALALGTGTIGSLSGKVAGDITAAYEGLKGNPDWANRAKQVKEATQDVLTYRPSTESGKALTNVLGTGLGLPFQTITYPTNKLGEYATEKGYPGLGYILQSGGESAALAGMPATTKKVGEIAQGVMDPIKAKKTSDAIIDTSMNTAIRPKVQGRGTSTLYNKKLETGRDMVNSVLENKNNIQLFDSNGNPRPAGSLPIGKNAVIQMADAINQTKLSIAKEFNAMKEAATGKGMDVSLDGVVEILDRKLQSPVIQDVPELYNYIEKQRDIFANRGTYSLDDANAQIMRLNNKGRIKKYYNDPNPNSMDYMTVDADIVRGLREGLDKSITSTEGPGFQALKKKYGSILDHEEEVNQRAVFEGRKNPKGLVDYADIVTAAEVAKGLAAIATKGNPVSLLVAATIQGAKHRIKVPNNPNNIISDMFTKADKLRGYYGTELNGPLSPLGPYDPWADQRGWKEPLAGLIEDTSRARGLRVAPS